MISSLRPLSLSPNIFSISQEKRFVNRFLLKVFKFYVLNKKILLTFYKLPIDFCKTICYNTSELKEDGPMES